MKGITKTILVLIATGLLSTNVEGNLVQLGAISFTGDFILNPSFNFNDPQAFPFGSFQTMTAQSATGIFGSYVAAGDVLTMNTPFMYVSGGSTPIVIPFVGTFFGSLAQPMEWSIDGFTINTLWDVITGADFAGRYCLGLTNLSGNGFDPSSYGLGATSQWDFTAPPYNTVANTSGPIDLQIRVQYDDGHVPDGGSTAALLGLGIVGMGALRRKLVSAR